MQKRRLGQALALSLLLHAPILSRGVPHSSPPFMSVALSLREDAKDHTRYMEREGLKQKAREGKIGLGEFIIRANHLDAEAEGRPFDLEKALRIYNKYLVQMHSTLKSKAVYDAVPEVLKDFDYHGSGGEKMAIALLESGGSCGQLSHITVALTTDSDVNVYLRRYGPNKDGYTHLAPIYVADGKEYDLVAGRFAYTKGVRFNATELIERYGSVNGGFSYPHSTEPYPGNVPLFSNQAIRKFNPSSAVSRDFEYYNAKLCNFVRNHPDYVAMASSKSRGGGYACSQFLPPEIYLYFQDPALYHAPHTTSDRWKFDDESPYPQTIPFSVISLDVFLPYKLEYASQRARYIEEVLGLGFKGPFPEATVADDSVVYVDSLKQNFHLFIGHLMRTRLNSAPDDAREHLKQSNLIPLVRASLFGELAAIYHYQDVSLTLLGKYEVAARAKELKQEALKKGQQELTELIGELPKDSWWSLRKVIRPLDLEYFIDLDAQTGSGFERYYRTFLNIDMRTGHGYRKSWAFPCSLSSVPAPFEKPSFNKLIEIIDEEAAKQGLGKDVKRMLLEEWERPLAAVLEHDENEIRNLKQAENREGLESTISCLEKHVLRLQDYLAHFRKDFEAWLEKQ